MRAPGCCALGPVDGGVKPEVALMLAATMSLDACTMSPDGMIDAKRASVVAEAVGAGVLEPVELPLLLCETDWLEHAAKLSMRAAGMAMAARTDRRREKILIVVPFVVTEPLRFHCPNRRYWVVVRWAEGLRPRPPWPRVCAMPTRRS